MEDNNSHFNLDADAGSSPSQAQDEAQGAGTKAPPPVKSKCLVKIIRAADKSGQKGTFGQTTSQRMEASRGSSPKIPVEELAGRKPKNPRGRFVTSGRLDTSNKPNAQGIFGAVTRSGGRVIPRDFVQRSHQASQKDGAASQGKFEKAHGDRRAQNQNKFEKAPAGAALRTKAKTGKAFLSAEKQFKSAPQAPVKPARTFEPYLGDLARPYVKRAAFAPRRAPEGDAAGAHAPAHKKPGDGVSHDKNIRHSRPEGADGWKGAGKPGQKGTKSFKGGVKFKGPGGGRGTGPQGQGSGRRGGFSPRGGRGTRR